MALLLPAACRDPGVGLTFDQRWAGTLTPQAPPGCGQPASGTLTRVADRFTFTPNDGVIVLHGAIPPDGHLHATNSLVGADHRPYDLTVDGTLTQASFDGTYQTPRCTWHALLKRVT